MAIRSGDWKLVRYCKNADSTQRASIKDPQATDARLYNLAQDIHEDKNLAKEMPEEVRELHAMWDEWNKPNIWALNKVPEAMRHFLEETNDSPS